MQGVDYSAKYLLYFCWNVLWMGLSTRALKLDSLDLDPRSVFHVVSHELHMTRTLRALHCWTGSHALSRSTVMQHSMQLRSRFWPCGGIVVSESGSHIRIRSRSKVLCEEPHCSYSLRVYEIVTNVSSAGSLFFVTNHKTTELRSISQELNQWPMCTLLANTTIQQAREITSCPKVPSLVQKS